MRLGLCKGEPAQGGDQAASKRSFRRSDRHDFGNSLFVFALKSQHRCCKHFPRLFPVEFLPAKVPALLARDAQAVEMSLDPLVELREVRETIVVAMDCPATEKPEERCLMSMLGNNNVH